MAYVHIILYYSDTVLHYFVSLCLQSFPYKTICYCAVACPGF